VNVARIARQDGQIPIVVLVQTRDLSDPDVLALLQDTLKANDIPYVATEEHQSPKDPAAFVPDGHYQPQVNAVFGQAFLDVVAAQAKRP
jgi:hypothetical protein